MPSNDRTDSEKIFAIDEFPCATGKWLEAVKHFARIILLPCTAAASSHHQGYSAQDPFPNCPD